MPTKAKTLANFMQENDRDTIVRKRITDGLSALLKIGREEHEAETDFAKRCSLQLAELTRFRDEFRGHVAFVPKLMGRKPRYVWFADAKVVPPKFRYQPESARG